MQLKPGHLPIKQKDRYHTIYIVLSKKKQTNPNRTLRESTESRIRLFRIFGSNNVKKDISVKIV